MGKPERNRSLGRPLHRLEDNIKMGLKIIPEGLDWTKLARDRGKWRAVVNTMLNLLVL